MEEARANLERLEDVISEVERAVRSLKRQAGKARRYNRLREAMDRLEKLFSVKRAARQEKQLVQNGLVRRG